MSEPYIGEIRMVGFNFAPVNWALCNGQTLSISQNEALFELIGTTYGGDGQETFALPNLQCRFPMHQGGGFILSEIAGEENVTLTLTQIPIHTHTLNAQAVPGTLTSPAGALWAESSLEQYSTGATASSMAASLEVTGQSMPHENMSPFQVINFVIAMFGVFPSQS